MVIPKIIFTSTYSVTLPRGAEYVLVNIIFGITNETTLNSSVDNARGAIVIRVYSEKGKGPARSQTLITTAVGVLETLNDTAKTNSGVFFRTGDIDGPTFSTTENPPLFEGRIDTSYFATVIS